MNKKKHPLHFLMLAAGIFLMGTGIAIIIKSQTGTSPMSSLTNVMTYVYAPISLGTYTFFLNFAFFVGGSVFAPLFADQKAAKNNSRRLCLLPFAIKRSTPRGRRPRLTADRKAA